MGATSEPSDHRQPGTPPAIAQRESGRADLLIFQVRDKIHKPDIEAMAEAVDAAMDEQGEIDIMLEFQTFDGVTLGATFDGEAMRASLRSVARVRRYAVVGAPAFAKAMINLFDPLVPVEAKTFEAGQSDEARAWVDQSSDPR